MKYRWSPSIKLIHCRRRKSRLRRMHSDRRSWRNGDRRERDIITRRRRNGRGLERSISCQHEEGKHHTKVAHSRSRNGKPATLLQETKKIVPSRKVTCCIQHNIVTCILFCKENDGLAARSRSSYCRNDNIACAVLYTSTCKLSN